MSSHKQEISMSSWLSPHLNELDISDAKKRSMCSDVMDYHMT